MNIQKLKEAISIVKTQFICLKVNDDRGILEHYLLTMGRIEELNSIVFLNFTIDFNFEYSESIYNVQEHEIDKLLKIDSSKPFKIKLNFTNFGSDEKSKIFDIEKFDFVTTSSHNIITFEYTYPLFKERGIWKKEKRWRDIKNKDVECSDEFVIMSVKHTYPQDEKDRHYKREIIQLSAGIYDHNLILLREFDTLVKPVINPVLSDRCKEITRINDEMLENAVNFKEAYNQFLDFLGESKEEYTYFAFDSNTLNQFKRSVYFDGGEECNFLHYTKNFYAIQDMYCIHEELKQTPSLNDIIRKEKLCTITPSMTINDKVRVILYNFCEKWGFSGQKSDEIVIIQDNSILNIKF